MFQGETYALSLRVVAGLGALVTELGLTLPQLAIGWALTNPGPTLPLWALVIATMSTKLWRRPRSSSIMR
jgi:aryl-alcohol dehydrogenase-like predicted oxidoreductase